MGTQTFHNDCNYVLTLYKYQVNCLFCFPDLLILICVPKLNAFHLLILSNSLKSLAPNSGAYDKEEGIASLSKEFKLGRR